MVPRDTARFRVDQQILETVMQHYFTDLRLEMDDKAQVRETGDGYLVAMPRVARTGIQLYLGSEVGVKDKQIVRIYRPEAEVFAQDSLASYAGKPMTDNHPPKMVDASNWKQFSAGQIGNDILRDGEWVRVPMIMMDTGLIAKFKAGKKQISMGYTCDIDMTAGTTSDGQAYDGIQKNLRMNHGAIVTAARAGNKALFGDSAADANKVFDGLNRALGAIREGRVVRDTALEGAGQGLLDGEYPFMNDGSVYLNALRDAQAKAKAAGNDDMVSALDLLLGQLKESTPTKDESMKTMVIDGITCEMSDTAIQVVTRALADASSKFEAFKKGSEEEEKKTKDALGTANANVAKLTTEAATKDAEIVTLKKNLDDAKITPQKLDGMVKDRAVIFAKAKALHPAVVVDGKDTADVMSQVVTAKLGAAAKDWNADQIKVSFDTLTAGVQVQATVDGVGDTARAFSYAPTGADNRQAQYDKRDAALSDAWKTPTAPIQ